MNTTEDPTPPWQPLTPQPPEQRPASPRVGDIVRLRSGGCKMMLVDLSDPPDDPDRRHLPGAPAVELDATVVWTTGDGQGGQLVLPVSCLVKVDEAKEAAELDQLFDVVRR